MDKGTVKDSDRISSQGSSEMVSTTPETEENLIKRHMRIYWVKISNYFEKKKIKGSSSIHSGVAEIFQNMLDTCPEATQCRNCEENIILRKKFEERSVKYLEELRELELRVERMTSSENLINEKLNVLTNKIDVLSKDYKKLLIKESKKEVTLKESEPVLIVDTTTEMNALSYRDALRSNIRQNKLERPADIIMPNKNRLIVKYDDKTKLAKIKENIENNPELNKNVRIKVTKPGIYRFIVFNVPVDLQEAELIQEIKLNGNLEDKKVELVSTFLDRKGNKNAVIDTDFEAAQYLLQNKKLLIDMIRLRVEKYINIKRCFRCQRFGHLATNCNREFACSKCGESHDSRQCNSKEEKCANCKATDHSASSKVCPSYLEYKDKHIERVRYG